LTVKSELYAESLEPALDHVVPYGGAAMTFKEVLAQVIDWLQQDQRISYRALKRQFNLDDAYLDDLKRELIEVRQCAIDQYGSMLVWSGSPAAAPTPGLRHGAEAEL
jgi:hypothetical protein